MTGLLFGVLIQIQQIQENLRIAFGVMPGDALLHPLRQLGQIVVDVEVAAGEAREIEFRRGASLPRRHRVDVGQFIVLGNQRVNRA